jgi:hypothetical protein
MTEASVFDFLPLLGLSLGEVRIFEPFGKRHVTGVQRERELGDL